MRATQCGASCGRARTLPISCASGARRRCRQVALQCAGWMVRRTAGEGQGHAHAALDHPCLQADLSDPTTLPATLVGVNAVIDCATARPEESTDKIDWEGKVALIQCAQVGAGRGGRAGASAHACAVRARACSVQQLTRMLRPPPPHTHRPWASSGTSSSRSSTATSTPRCAGGSAAAAAAALPQACVWWHKCLGSFSLHARKHTHARTQAHAHTHAHTRAAAQVPLMNIKHCTEKFLATSGLQYTTLRLCGFHQVRASSRHAL